MEEFNHRVTVTPISIIVDAITDAGICESQLFARSGMPPGWWDTLMTGEVSITPAIAEVLHRVFPTRSPLYWLSMQMQYDFFLHALRRQRQSFEMARRPSVNDIIAHTDYQGLQQWFRMLYELYQIEQCRAEEFGAALFQIEHVCHRPASAPAAVDVARLAAEVIHTFDPDPQPVRLRPAS